MKNKPIAMDLFTIAICTIMVMIALVVHFLNNEFRVYNFDNCYRFNKTEHVCKLKGRKSLTCTLRIKKGVVKYMYCKEGK